MDVYLKVVQELSMDFTSFELTKIPRRDNTTANALVAFALTSDPHLRRVILVESITVPRITLPKRVCHVTELEKGQEENNKPGDPHFDGLEEPNTALYC